MTRRPGRVADQPGRDGRHPDPRILVPVVAAVVAPLAAPVLAPLAISPPKPAPIADGGPVRAPPLGPRTADHRDTARIEGFTASSTRRQRRLERRFLAVPSPAGAAETAAWLSAAPHMAGTVRQRRLADSLAHRFRAMGFDVEVQDFAVRLPHPGSLSLELLSPRARQFDLREGRSELPDPYAWTWNAFSADGTARGPAVYANYGRPEDYGALKRAGVEVQGKIVLARYGKIYRGTKVREAEKRGAAGVVLYPDPADGGFPAGDTVPVGPQRPAGSAQRGTVAYLWRYPGDPLTPGRPARAGIARLEPARARDLPSIPVLNVDGAQARDILDAVGGPQAPADFQGGWPGPYHLGEGPAVLRLSVQQEYRRRSVRNVLARLPGREDRSVIVGNHYDAWVNGGVDPHSGTAAVMEIARGLSALREGGWRPRRDIVLAFWDAEEFGAVGSTEFVEARRRRLAREAVAYFNVDVLTAGSLDVSGSPSLRDLVWSAAAEVEDPIRDATLAEAWRQARGDSPDTETSRVRAPSLGALGVGSDWTAFFHFAGVPSLQWTMNGRGTYAVYHSALDDFGYLRTHADSALLYTPQLARVMGLAALRLAEADALQFDYVRYADRIEHLVDSVATARGRQGKEATSVERLQSLRAAIAEFRGAAKAVAAGRRRALWRGDAAYLERLNRRLPRVEGAFLREEKHLSRQRGQERHRGETAARPWYRHLIYTADPRTGYGALPVPALQPNRVEGGPGHAPSPSELGRALRSAAARLRTIAR